MNNYERIKNAYDLIIKKEELEMKIKIYSDLPLHPKYPCISYEYYADSSTGNKTARIKISEGQLRCFINSVINDLEVQINAIQTKINKIMEAHDDN